MEEPAPPPASIEPKKPPTKSRRTARDPASSTSAQQAREKQKRIAACDVCRLRKVKCVKNPSSSSNNNNTDPDLAKSTEGSEEIVKGASGGGGGERCMGCTELNRECTYEYLPKRPGPPNPYARPTSFGPAHGHAHGIPSSERYAPYPHPHPHPGHSAEYGGADAYPAVLSANGAAGGGGGFGSPSRAFHPYLASSSAPPMLHDDRRLTLGVDRHAYGNGNGNAHQQQHSMHHGQPSFHPHYHQHPQHPHSQAQDERFHPQQQHRFAPPPLPPFSGHGQGPERLNLPHQAYPDLSATGHSLPPPGENAHHVNNGYEGPHYQRPAAAAAMSASSPSLSGASGYSPNQPTTTGTGGSASGGMTHANGNANRNGNSHERDREYPHDRAQEHAERQQQQRQREYAHQASSSIPLSTLINSNATYVPERGVPSPLPPPNASTAALGNGSAGSASAMMDDNWFMPWICSTPTTPAFPGYQGTGAAAVPVAGGQWNIPRALLPGDLEPLVEQVVEGAGAGNVWADSLAAVTKTGLLPHQHHAQHHSNPQAQQSHVGQGQSYNSHKPPTISDRRGEMYPSHSLGMPSASAGIGTANGMPLGMDLANQRPRHGSNARESFTSTRSAGALVSGKVGAPVQVIEIEEMVSWSHVLSFLSLYHEHLYPLLPLMHWPSFSQLLISRHDKQDIVFRCFLLSLVAYSILQLPKSVIPPLFTQEELVALHRKCHQASRRMQARVYDPLELNHISCDHIYLGSTGKDNAANVVLAEAMRLAITLALHDENVAEQQGLDAIERDCRRRVFWVLYGSDRTIAALISCPMLLSDDDIDVGDILECDDSLITAAGAFPQPAGKTPILSGFIHVTRIFRLLSRVLRYVRAKAKSNAREDGDDGMTTDRGYERFPDPRVLIESLQALLDDLPVPLRLQSHNTEHRSKAEAQAFDTCKANILVSQVLVRFAIYQYAMLHSAGQAETCLTELTDDVLRRLHEMSSESLAANGESIRHKVLFIASSLLNKYPGNNAGADHVAEFLAVYNKILTNQNKLGMDVEIAEDGEPAGEEG